MLPYLYYPIRDPVSGATRTQYFALESAMWVLLFALVRFITKSNGIAFCISFVSFFAVFYGHMFKLGHFGGPITPLDGILVLKVLYYGVLSIHLKLIIVLLGSLSIVIYLFVSKFLSSSIQLRRLVKRSLIAGLFSFGCLGIILPYAPKFEEALNLSPGLHRKNSFWIGPTSYLVLQTLKLVSLKFYGAQPTSSLFSPVENSHTFLKTLPKPASPSRSFVPRDIVLVHMESFYDPSLYPTPLSAPPPYFPSFSDLFSKYGREILVPTRGGGSAATELEIQCGIPAGLLEDTPGIEFATYLQNDVPCIPTILKKYGYRTAVIFPSFTQYFSEVTAYKHLGFDEVFMASALKTRDYDGSWPSDASVYSFAHQWRESISKDTPVFLYIITTAAHFPMGRNKAVRPDVYAEDSPWRDNLTLANRFYYSTKEFIEFRDRYMSTFGSRNLLIGYGDHLPNDSVQLSSSPTASELIANHTTPILASEQLLKDYFPHLEPLPAYFFPSLLLTALGISVPHWMNSFVTLEPTFHTFAGLSPLIRINSDWRSCDTLLESPSLCYSRQELLGAMVADLLIGKQELLTQDFWK